MLLSDLLEVLSPVPVEADLLLAELIEPFSIALDWAVKAGLVLIVVLIARLYYLFMMICILDVYIAWELVLLAYYGASGDGGASGRARFIYRKLAWEYLPLNSLTSKRDARSISKGEGPNPGHLRVMRLPVSYFCNWAVKVFILACFFSTISSPGSWIKSSR